jgi:hypothetical protein
VVATELLDLSVPRISDIRVQLYHFIGIVNHESMQVMLQQRNLVMHTKKAICNLFVRATIEM